MSSCFSSGLYLVSFALACILCGFSLGMAVAAHIVTGRDKVNHG
jgi:hypothetical protein